MNRRELLTKTGCCAGIALARLVIGPQAVASIVRAPLASTTLGRVRGYLDRGIQVFKGIPYGAETTARRFMPPVAPAPWTGVRDTLEFGPRAPQSAGRDARSAGYHLPPELGPMSEDCLYLNVWTPALRDGRKRPVMVYFHGGAYSGGSANNALYDGVNLCRRGDVVVVTLNHRLNLFGYLYLAELGGPEFADSACLTWFWRLNGCATISSSSVATPAAYSSSASPAAAPSARR